MRNILIFSLIFIFIFSIFLSVAGNTNYSIDEKEIEDEEAYSILEEDSSFYDDYGLEQKIEEELLSEKEEEVIRISEDYYLDTRIEEEEKNQHFLILGKRLLTNEELKNLPDNFLPALRVKEIKLNPVITSPGRVKEGDVIILNLFPDAQFIANVNGADVNIDKTFTIRGKIRDTENAFFSISTTNNHTLGFIELYLKKYSIITDSNKNLFYLIEIDIEKQKEGWLPEGAPQYSPEEEKKYETEIIAEEITVNGEISLDGLEKEEIKNLIKELSIKEDLGNIEFEDPRETGILLSDIFEIKKVLIGETFINEEGLEEPKTFTISGFGPPNTLLVLYIFSTPIIVTVKTDSNGIWSYTLDKELEDGSHEIYVASVDNTGKVIAKSNPFFFVKEAAAITEVIPTYTVTEEGFFQRNLFLILLSSLILIILSGIVLIGVRKKDISK